MKIKNIFTILFSMILLNACTMTKGQNKEIKMEQAHIIESVIYQTKADVKDSDHIKKSLSITPILSKFDGFISRQFSKGKNGKWIDLVYWKDLPSAEKAAQAVTSIPECQLFFNDIDQQKMDFMHSEIIEQYP